MVKIIGIFAIVLVYYCEINAELNNLQYRKPRLTDVQRILPLRKQFSGSQFGGIKLQSNDAQAHNKFTTGFREDIKDSHGEYVLMNGEARYNDMEHHVVIKRRFKRNYRDEENNQIDEHDSERKKRKKKKKHHHHHHHHSRRKMNKNHNSTKNKITKRYKNDTKRNDMEEKYNEDKNKKHQYHSGRKMQENNNSTRNKITKRYKNDTKRNGMEQKYNEDKNKKHHYHSGRKMQENNNSTRNKITKRYKNETKRNDMEEKYNEDKNKKHQNHSGRKMQKSNNNSTRNNETKRYHNEDRNRHKDKKLVKEKNHSGKRNRDKNHSKYSEYLKNMSMSYKREKDHIHKKKKGKDKSKDKQREKNMDRNKHATTGGPMRISQMDMMSPANKNYHKHNKKQKLNKSKDKQREKSQDHNKHARTGGPKRISKMGMMTPANKNDHKRTKKQELNKSKGKQREKSNHTIDISKTAIGIAGLGAAGVAALVEKPVEWISIKEPKLQSEEVLTFTTTPKLQSKEVLTFTTTPKLRSEKVLTFTTTPKLRSEEVLTFTTTPKLRSEEVLRFTTTPKPPPGSVQEQKVVKLIKRERPNLRMKEKIRVTRIVSLTNEEDEEKQNLRQQPEEKKSPTAGSPPSDLSPYAITAQMELLMKEFPNVNATVTKVGRTVEYNDIVLVSITEKKPDSTYFRAQESKYVDDAPEKKIIFIVHGLTVMGLKDMTSLVKSSELKVLISYYLKHLDKFDFFLMPLANPDGYSASLSPERTIWNKNVSPQSVCPGVFVDRNFDVAWNYTNEISSCSQVYPGATAFSEEESKVIRDIFHQFSHKILAYIHVHAGTFDYKVFKGDAILYPRGYTVMQSDDDKYIDIKAEVDEAMKNASFRVMTATVDTLSNWYGVVSGTSVDYAATVFGITYAMEFVMQLYDSESLNNNALTEIWSRLIDATFNQMWKSLQERSDGRKFG